MIKKIRSTQLRLGMHVHEFCGSWMDHPFWRARFTLKTEAELRRIVSGGVTELWIDTGKGLDVLDETESTEDRSVVDAEVKKCQANGWTLITSRTPDDLPAFNQAIANAVGG